MAYSLYIIGFPSLYGGAGTELYHQIKVWKQMGVEMHLIPTQKNAHGAGLYPEMVKLGVTVHEGYDWEAIPAGAPVISFCNEEFLTALPKIRKRTGRTVFVNCMTWLFGREKEAMRRGDISLFLYQNSNVMGNVMPRLRALNPDPAIRFMTFRPYLMRQIFLLPQGVPRTGLEPDTFPGRMKISSARIRGIFTSILLLRSGRGELFSVLTSGAR